MIFAKMGTQEIYSIWRQIVIDSTYQKVGQLNSFAVLDSLSQLNAVNGEMSPDDYKKGFYWSRSTRNRGGLPSTIKLEFDLLFCETIKTSNMDSPSDRDTRHQLFVSVASPTQCPNDRLIPEIDDRNLVNLQSAIREFLSYGLYSVKIQDQMAFLDGVGMASQDGTEWLFDQSTTTPMWLSEGRAAYFKTLPGVTVTGPTMVDIRLK